MTLIMMPQLKGACMFTTEVELDGTKMNTVKGTHLYLKDKLNLSPLYGENLDALWDELSTRNYPISIKISNLDVMIKQLGAYSNKLIEVFSEVSMYNKSVIIDFNADKEII